jgi:5-formyltetrahydrofolate cyclo-ligase
MKKTYNNKEDVRADIKLKKSELSPAQLDELSEEVIEVLECMEMFANAKCVLIYYSLHDEVQTHRFIEKYFQEKRFLLPVVKGGELEIRDFNGLHQMEKSSSFGILEPVGDAFVDYDKIDLVIVPGVAFDRELNRLGRGKGYYDMLLPKINAPKVGLCFDFQLLDTIPNDNFDVKMNMIVAQNEIIME